MGRAQVMELVRGLALEVAQAGEQALVAERVLVSVLGQEKALELVRAVVQEEVPE